MKTVTKRKIIPNSGDVKIFGENYLNESRAALSPRPSALQKERGVEVILELANMGEEDCHAALLLLAIKTSFNYSQDS